MCLIVRIISSSGCEGPPLRSYRESLQSPHSADREVTLFGYSAVTKFFRVV